MKFNSLLKEASFKPEKVFLLRHQDPQRVRSGLYQAWKSRPKDFEAYQSIQKWKNRFPEGSSVAAFVVGPERETLFIGMYDVLKLSRSSRPYIDPLTGPFPAEDYSVHQLKHSSRMRDFEEKLVIDWGLGAKSWRQHAANQDKTVLEIRARSKDEPFPPYTQLLRRLGDLQNVYPSWKVRLKERTGVYLLAFDDGAQYVGSATGEEGFWQRWCDYLKNGHGGNRVLIRDKRDARDATVSILEVSGSAQTDRDIINQEMLWKRKLGTRAKPLDSE